jgi:outer membrane protein assembly factor BamB
VKPLHWFLALSFSGLTTLLPIDTRAQDWPQFLGPDRNLKTTGTNLNFTWPGGEAPVLWRKDIGSGWSGPVVAAGKLVVHHREDDEEIAACFDALTGAPLWEFRSPTTYRDSQSSDFGPRATPAIADGRVLTFGAAGRLTCLDLETGNQLWTVDARKDYEAGTGFFGMNCSPLIEGGLVLMQIGGRNQHGIIAFEAATGRLRWKATDHQAGYSSPVAATIGGQRQALFFTREGLVATDPQTGRVMYEFPWRSRQHASVNAASPVVIGDRILLSASYDTGAVMLRVIGEGVRPLWRGDSQLSSHYATPIHHRDMIFGFHGRVDFPTGAELRAIDAATGALLWSMDPISSGSLLLVNDTLLVLTESGELFAAPVSSREYKPVVRAQILGKETRAQSALANGIYYARGKGKLVAIDLRQPGS